AAHALNRFLRGASLLLSDASGDARAFSHNDLDIDIAAPHVDALRSKADNRWQSSRRTERTANPAGGDVVSSRSNGDLRALGTSHVELWNYCSLRLRFA